MGPPVTSILYTLSPPFFPSPLTHTNKQTTDRCDTPQRTAISHPRMRIATKVSWCRACPPAPIVVGDGHNCSTVQFGSVCACACDVTISIFSGGSGGPGTSSTCSTGLLPAGGTIWICFIRTACGLVVYLSLLLLLLLLLAEHCRRPGCGRADRTKTLNTIRACARRAHRCCCSREMRISFAFQLHALALYIELMILGSKRAPILPTVHIFRSA